MTTRANIGNTPKSIESDQFHNPLIKGQPETFLQPPKRPAWGAFGVLP